MLAPRPRTPGPLSFAQRRMPMTALSPPESTAPPLPPPKLLVGQKALVTGANSGIGRGVAIALGQAGADVVVNYVTDEPAADAVVNEIEQSGAKAYAHQGRCFRRRASDRHVRSDARALRHHRYPGRQCRPAARFRLQGHDAGAMEHGARRQSDRAVPVRARGGPRIPAARRRRRPCRAPPARSSA